MEEKIDRTKLNELKVFKRVGLTKNGYKIIRQQKKLQKKSMVRIIDNLIIEKYGFSKIT
uniref:Uncharacterized protein n=1 Tax=viral metagenome TaxID=1070528 RepID=A0A6H1ZMM6_9ZZZZ